MAGFIQGIDRAQATMLPECLDDWVDESNPVRFIDAFVDGLDLRDLGFAGVDPAETGRPAYHPSVHLKLYVYGYLNRVGPSASSTILQTLSAHFFGRSALRGIASVRCPGSAVR